MTENMPKYNKKSLKIPKGIIKVRKSKMDGQHNCQGKGTSNDLQNNTQNTKDRETRTPLRTGDAPEE